MPRRSNNDPLPHETWGAAMRAYEKEKSDSVPPMDKSQPRFTRNDGAGRQRMARDYDIVSCAPRSAPSGNSTVSGLGSTASGGNDIHQAAAAHVQKAMEKSLKKAYHCYDIVTMEPKYGIDEATVSAIGGNQEPRGKRIRHPDPLVDYDIVTNERMPERAHLSAAREAQESKPRRAKPARATNILNHQYVEGHDEKTAADRAAMLAKIERAVDASRPFNPITQQWNDASKEMAARREKAAEEDRRREVVATHTYDTSYIVKRSEGHAFDIVTNHVYNPDMVLALDRREMTSIPQRAALRQQWEQRRDAEEALRDADVDRALRRVAKDRVKDSVAHGYDILSNAPFVQVDAADTKTKPHLLTIAESTRLKSVAEVLNEATQPKPTKESAVLCRDGPRTTTERLFGAADPRTAGFGATFEGRRQLLLPTLEKVKARAPDTGSAFLGSRNV